MIITSLLRTSRRFLPFEFLYSNTFALLGVTLAVVMNSGLLIYGAESVSDNSVSGFKFSDGSYWVFYVFIFAALLDLYFSVAEYLKFKTYPYRVYVFTGQDFITFVPFKTRKKAEEYKFNFYLKNRGTSRNIETEIFSQYESLSGEIKKIWN